MSATSKIEWTDATWNPLRGCEPIGPGCKNCYAMRMMARGLPGLNSPTTGEPFAIMTPSGPRWTGEVELIESMLDLPLRWKRPRRIFVNSISDTFHKDVPDEWLDRIFAVMALCPQHTFILLTKRGERMWKYFFEDMMGRGARHRVYNRSYGLSAIWQLPTSVLWPLPNVWLGVSASTRPDLDAQIEHLRATPAAVRFLSLEPLIADLGTIDLSGIGWCIVGGESGPGARPCQVEWIRSVVRQCAAANVSCFVKQMGFVWAREGYDMCHANGEKWNHKGSDPAEWPIDLQVREMPR